MGLALSSAPLFASVAAFGLAACASPDSLFDPILGQNGCDFTQIGPSYTYGGPRALTGLRRSLVMEYVRVRNDDGPIVIVRIAPPSGDQVRQLWLGWTANQRDVTSCYDAINASDDSLRVCSARVPATQISINAHFDADVADPETRIGALINYVKEEVVCAPENIDSEDLRDWQRGRR